MSFDELMVTGGIGERKQLQELQNELQCDDPINIQFTSVSNSLIFYICYKILTKRFSPLRPYKFGLGSAIQVITCPYSDNPKGMHSHFCREKATISNQSS